MGPVVVGLGIFTALRAVATLLRSASSRPASPAVAAMPAVATLAARKLRRAGSTAADGPGARASQSRPCAADGLITPPVPVIAGGRSGAASSAAPSAPSASSSPVSPHESGHACGAAKVPAVTGGPIRPISTRSTTAAAAVAASVGSTLDTVAVGRVAAAVSPMAANTTRPAMPYASRRVAATPIRAAKIPSTTRMPLTRTSLSSEPNSLIAKFFSQGGVKSICNCPTATTGDPVAPVRPATSCPTPSAVPAASTPAIAPSPARRLAPGSSGSRPLPIVSIFSIRCRRPRVCTPGRQSVAAACYEYES